MATPTPVDPINTRRIVASPRRLGALAAVGLLTVAACGGGDGPTISFDAKDSSGSVSPLLFGVNHRWASNAVGSADPLTGLTYPAVVEATKDIGITLIRYPAGTLANTFQWELAIGPLAQRSLQVGGLVPLPLPQNSNFGPDEYGKLLDATGATGSLMLNFATATAADAANFVAYMTAAQGSAPANGVDWAAKRAANGHAAPYNITYAEIGNEYDPAIQPLVDQNYWIKGTPVTIDPSCAADKIACLYALGGSTRFDGQRAVAPHDWTAKQSVSTGAPSQTMYARYKPVLAGSETVFVDAVAWERVADFGTSAADAKVYRIDNKSGAIGFGDGVHGAIPATGAIVTVSYTSGPHEGFIEFRRAIKAVNAAIKVCSSINDASFIKIMGEAYAYDCIAQHPYTLVAPTIASNLNDYFLQMMASAASRGTSVAKTRQAIDQYAGANAAKVSLLLSEYGQLGTMPSYATNFLRSQGQGVMHALVMKQWIDNGIEAAGRHALTDYTFEKAPPDIAAVGLSPTAGDNVLLGGPGPNPVRTPVALAMKLLRQHTGGTRIAAQVEGGPLLQLPDGKTLDALHVTATVDEQGQCYLVVVNADPVNSIDANVVAKHCKMPKPEQGHQGSQAPQVAISTLSSPAITDDNDREHPTRVSVTTQSVPFSSSRPLALTLPPHSVTALKLSR
jgi:alpha-L-arabinofuranosidase